MKTSKYNIYLTENNSFYIFNQLSSSLTQVDKELYLSLLDNNLDELDNPSLIQDLYENNYICDDALIEENQILAINKYLRYGKDYARITILPTINCNFKCWYCYESHIESVMTQENMNAVLEFCKNTIVKNRVSTFHLDWFGGEPLLYFDEIIYPLASQLKELCRENEVTFIHTITTNGYLITKSMIEKFKEIKLNSFQITLDGAEFYHNKTRFSSDDKNTYRTIVDNIADLCLSIENIDMTVRINYTPKNLSTIDDIAYSFPENIRKHIFIEPQIVWQFKNVINSISDIIKEKLSTFIKLGYKTYGLITPQMSRGCYVENMLQYVINYDLSVYKCTARDFLSPKTSIGVINGEGKFTPNSNYYNYFVSSYIENEKCLACRFLPSCNGMCIQKKIENTIPKCPIEEVEHSLENQLKLIINSQKQVL